MRSVSREMFRILNNEKFQPIQLLDLRLVGTASTGILRFTDAGEELSFEGNTYQAINFSRGTIEEILSSESGEYPGTTLTFSNVNTQMATLLNTVELEGAVATLRMIDRRLLSDSRHAFVIAQGEIKEPQLSESALSFTINSIIGTMERLIVPRRLWQQQCNYTFGSAACGVNIKEAPYTLECQLETGSTDRSLVIPATLLSDAGDPADPTEFWAAGYVVMKDGVAATQGRPFQLYRYDEENSRHVIVVRVPFLVAPAMGDTIVIRRGCRKVLADCKARQGSYVRYGGFPYVPYGRLTPNIVSDY